MRLSGEWFENDKVQAVLAMLTKAGQQAYLVGGCVRNAILDQPIADIDIATDALPERVMALADAAGFKAIPTGIDHGTVTVIVSGNAYEITTYRRDVETDGRRAVVAFSTDIKDDAARRDLTMNALYADAKGQLIDPIGGLPDLIARRVRFVGDAQDRIREDYLRILRFFRFHAWYGNPAEGLDADGLAACAQNSDGIETLSKERVGHEMLRLLAAPDPAPSVAAMQAAGVLARVLPESDARALAPLVHLEDETAPNPIRRLAALGGVSVDQALRLSRDQTRQLEILRDAIGSLAPAHELGYRLGRAAAQDALLLRAAVLETPLPANWQSDITKGAGATFPIAAADLMPALQGPALGEALKTLEARWVASGFALSREQLLA